VFWVILVYFNIRNTLLKSGTFLLGHPVYHYQHVSADRLDDRKGILGLAGEWEM